MAAPCIAEHRRVQSSLLSTSSGKRHAQLRSDFFITPFNYRAHLLSISTRQFHTVVIWRLPRHWRIPRFVLYTAILSAQCRTCTRAIIVNLYSRCVVFVVAPMLLLLMRTLPKSNIRCFTPPCRSYCGTLSDPFVINLICAMRAVCSEAGAFFLRIIFCNHVRYLLRRSPVPILGGQILAKEFSILSS